ncbi:aminotransferase class I/II-fold pyridoxal phosphate-dependent enzyme [Ruminococcaceae bacterium OttesenSCG-928-A11]|nr:aminotransferase class I/II-fold pyridoxal phosphate-dependent enzyme [Ruminococcaceae bacterium OttesenSCG-928-A11]
MQHRWIAERHRQNEENAMTAADQNAKAYPDLINLSLGDPDLITDEVIIEAAFADAKAGHTKYTDFQGDPELRREIIRYYDEEFAMPVADNEVIVTTSGTMAMYMALEAMLNEGDEVLMPTPCFTPYPGQVRLARGVPVPVETRGNEDFQISPQQLEQHLTGKTKAIILNTPSNPTGAVLTQKTLEGVAAFAKQHDLVVIADEIYTLYQYSGAFSPFAKLPGMAERTVTINSFSKDYIMTGWRVGCAIGPDFLIDAMRHVMGNVAFTCPSVSQRAALYALRNRKTIQPKIRAEYEKRVFAAAAHISRIPKLSVRPPEGTFYLFADITATGKSSAQVADAILHEAHVLVLPGDVFGPGGEGYIRIACTCGVEKMDEALDRVAAVEIFQA